jgi:Ca2+/Na+ antiporter
MDTYLSLYVIGNSLTILGQLCVWVFCVLLLIRERSLASVLLIIGSTLFTLSGALGIILQAVFAKMSPEMVLKYQGISFIVTAIFYLTFTVGLILFFLKYFKLIERLKDPSLDQKSI